MQFGFEVYILKYYTNEATTSQFNPGPFGPSPGIMTKSFHISVTQSTIYKHWENQSFE